MTAFCGFTPENRFFLAPMAGVTDAAFRMICREDADIGVFLVCDGMGGAKAGEVASSMAADAFLKEIGSAWQTGCTRAMLEDAYSKVNDTLFDAARNNPDYSGMGTTMVSALCRGGKVLVGNVGDSRAYFLDETGMRQVTEDHSLVTELVKRGDLTPYQASRHPSRSVITRAMGAEATVCCDVFAEQGRPGQYLLLCSDGLIREVSDPEIYYEVFQAEHPETACQRLLDLAKSRGGRDNITVVLIAF